MTTIPPDKPDLSREELEELAKDYMPMVKRIAAGFARRVPYNISTDDLMGAGMLGLADATSRYDPNRAEQFRSFAEARVRGAMIDELRAMGPLSRELRAKSNQLTKTIQLLEKELNRQPDGEEIAERMNLTVEEYHKMLVQLQQTTVLSPAIVDNAREHPRGYPDRTPGNPQDAYLFAELRERLAEAISELSPREQRVLAAYYKEERSLREIGEHFGVTESRICQVRSEAVHRLRAILEEKENG